MTDQHTTVAELRTTMAQFVAERDWNQFHAPKNLAMSISIEAAELMEHFQWIGVEASRHPNLSADSLQRIGEEIADVVAYSLALVNELNLDLTTILKSKMESNREKYPVEKFRGKFGPEDSGSND
jgi:NTP pyrophosphatase (non-canonical NTP hydrolase)